MIAVLFPGQGSQAMGMGCDLYDASAAARATFDEASEVLGYDLTGVCRIGPPEELARKREILHRHCADIGRDPTEIMISSHVRFDGDPAATAADAAALSEAGAQLAIVQLRPPHSPSVLEPLAAALSELA